MRIQKVLLSSIVATLLGATGCSSSSGDPGDEHALDDPSSSTDSSDWSESSESSDCKDGKCPDDCKDGKCPDDCKDGKCPPPPSKDDGGVPDDGGFPDDGGVPEGCTLTQGYWKTHPEDWPIASVDVPGTSCSYDADDLVSFQGNEGDASVILARQYIAARLNEEIGADTSAIDSILADAEAWFACAGCAPALVSPSDTTCNQNGRTGTQIADILADYNEGEIGPGHCPGFPMIF